MSLSCSVELLSDTFYKHFWTQTTCRHVTLRVTVADEGAAVKEYVEFQLLVPEDVVEDLSGDLWHPLEKQELDGKIYYSWSNFGATPEVVGSALGAPLVMGGTMGGEQMDAGSRYSYMLRLDLKPEADSMTVLWRICEDNDPVTDFFSEKILLTPYKPSL